MNLSKASLELRLMWIAKSLKGSGHDFSRLEETAELLSGMTGAKFEEEAVKKEWKTTIFLPFDDVVPDHVQDVMSAIDAIIDPVPIQNSPQAL